jgi:putative transposase
MTMSSNLYQGLRFPREVIEHAVWLYHRFSLSMRDVELILAARGVVVSYESIREWGLRFGRIFANTLKRRRPQPGDKWYMDEVFIRSRGKQHYLWRAADQDGNVLDILVQSRRSARATRCELRCLTVSEFSTICNMSPILMLSALGALEERFRRLRGVRRLRTRSGCARRGFVAGDSAPIGMQNALSRHRG